MSYLINSPLGKNSGYVSTYQPDLLFPIARCDQRENIGIKDKLPFYGVDVWNAYELSWLNAKGKPVVAMAQFQLPCSSSNIIESKSFKLYLNSFNNTKFASLEEVQEIIKKDLSEAAGTEVAVVVSLLHHSSDKIQQNFDGICLDDLDITCETYQVDANLLSVENDIVSETVYSDLLKSNCLITSQPDWGSLQITYTGKKIQHEGLLKYIVSFRNHNEFHEHCVERIFVDIMQYCKPITLTVHAKYVRRGGLDINPIRSTEMMLLDQSLRLCRQ